MVPLVFKTSLGAVRSSEGSTPSLLRQRARDEGDSPVVVLIHVQRRHPARVSGPRGRDGENWGHEASQSMAKVTGRKKVKLMGLTQQVAAAG